MPPVRKHKLAGQAHCPVGEGVTVGVRVSMGVGVAVGGGRCEWV